MQSRDGGHGASPKNGYPSSHTPIRAKRSTPNNRAPLLSRNKTIGDRPNRQLGRNKTIRPRDRARRRPPQPRQPNRETLSDRPTLPTIPQRTTDHPEHTVERGKHDSQTNPEENDARIDDEPFHREAHETGASATTTRKPALRAHTARVAERARKRDAVA